MSVDDFELLDEQMVLTAVELARACNAPATWVEDLVAHGVIEPVSPHTMQYSAVSVVRLRKARRLERDFNLNTPGIALVLDLLDEIERLRATAR